jgi:hypothetical protein
MISRVPTSGRRPGPAEGHASVRNIPHGPASHSKKAVTKLNSITALPSSAVTLRRAAGIHFPFATHRPFRRLPWGMCYVPCWGHFVSRIIGQILYERHHRLNCVVKRLISRPEVAATTSLPSLHEFAVGLGQSQTRLQCFQRPHRILRARHPLPSGVPTVPVPLFPSLALPTAWHSIARLGTSAI